MPLDDARIVRYGRQILLPEVGGRGQERLLAAAVAVVGVGHAASTAALLLGRAGIGRLEIVGGEAPTSAPDCTVVRHTHTESIAAVDVGLWFGAWPPAAWRGPAVWAGPTPESATVLALPGSPCVHCTPPPGPGTRTPDAVSTDAALGALAAAEVLRLLLRPATARRSRLGPAGPHLQDIAPTAPCPACPRGSSREDAQSV